MTPFGWENQNAMIRISIADPNPAFYINAGSLILIQALCHHIER
jgi:hypothetical protein